MKFSIKHFLRKCDQIRSFLRFWSHLLKKSFMENFIFCAVNLLFKVGLLSEDYGKHFLEVEGLLEKHELAEADITGQAEHVQNTNVAADSFLQSAQETESEGAFNEVFWLLQLLFL